jgi:hypothetical protein
MVLPDGSVVILGKLVENENVNDWSFIVNGIATFPTWMTDFLTVIVLIGETKALPIWRKHFLSLTW